MQGNLLCNMKTGNLIRFICFFIAWLLLAVWMLRLTEKITLLTIFWIIASGIIILVPLYKKYTKQP